MGSITRLSRIKVIMEVEVKVGVMTQSHCVYNASTQEAEAGEAPTEARLCY